MTEITRLNETKFKVVDGDISVETDSFVEEKSGKVWVHLEKTPLYEKYGRKLAGSNNLDWIIGDTKKFDLTTRVKSKDSTTRSETQTTKRLSLDETIKELGTFLDENESKIFTKLYQKAKSAKDSKDKVTSATSALETALKNLAKLLNDDEFKAATGKDRADYTE